MVQGSVPVVLDGVVKSAGKRIRNLHPLVAVYPARADRAAEPRSTADNPSFLQLFSG